jgi:hypothetical protein
MVETLAYDLFEADEQLRKAAINHAANKSDELLRTELRDAAILYTRIADRVDGKGKGK